MSVGPQNFDIRFHVAWTKQLTFWHAQYWFPREMPPEDQAQKFHADEVSSPRSGGAVPRGTITSTNQSTSQIWVVTRHQYGISPLVSQKSFRGETNEGVAKCQPSSPASLCV